MHPLLDRLAGAFVLFVAVVDAAAGDVPRYKLMPGEEIRYQTIDDFTSDAGVYRDRIEWTAWITRRNDDGSAHVILRKLTRSQEIKDGKPAEIGTPRTEFLHFDLPTDGRIANVIPSQPEPYLVFPMLPTRATDQAWDQSIEFAGIHYVRAAHEAHDAEFVFEARRVAPEDAIYLISDVRTFRFDQQRGLVASVDSRSSKGYGFKGSGHAQTTLSGVETRPAGWIDQLDRESRAYFDAIESYQRQADLAPEDAAGTDGLLAQAEARLRATRQKLTFPELINLLDEAISRHVRSARFLKEESELRARIVNHPAIRWSLKDLSGRSHSLSDYRGKIVLLDFWYRDCVWCMRAMPQVKALAADLKDLPVVVLGMNTDADPRNARFVVEQFGLKYNVLRVDPRLPELAKFGVEAFPTLIIIDPHGIVRGIHAGYSPDLKKSVERDVQRLLKTAR